ncbi:MAG: glycine cleavage system protein GcvH [Acidobacteria bacterium]|nr:glycine cleavage system protein GcvH [Acidobacteriota bacterium]
MTPQDLRYHREHTWARVEGDQITIGITDYAQEQLHDVVYVGLPEVGTTVEQNQPFGEIESTKAVNDLYAPVSGTVVERNDALASQPTLVNTDAYGQGWMIRVRPGALGDVDALLDAATYEKHTATSRT